VGLLQEIAREAALRRVTERVKKLDRAYVTRWIAGDLWIVDTLARDRGREIRAWKPIVLETLDAITPDEVLTACRQARPDLDDLWATPGARTKIEAEWRRGRALVEKM